jgi:hypothetical protein
MKSWNPEAQWRRCEEEEILEFVEQLGITKEEFKKTKDTLYHPSPVDEAAEKAKEEKWHRKNGPDWNKPFQNKHSK